jgi:putative transposase
MWTQRGVRPLVPAAGTNERRCVYGALNYATGQTHYLLHPKKNAQQFAEFLGQLLESNRRKFLILVLDNATYHTTPEVLDLLAVHETHTFVIWLPKYSPELNAIEGLWGYLKRSGLNNYFFGTAASMEAAIHETMAELQQHPETALALTYKTGQNLRKTA